MLLYKHYEEGVNPMACIVYRTDAGGRKYAYSSESYWDPEKQQPRSKRTYLGRVDPVTGEIIRGRQNGKNYKPPTEPARASEGAPLPQDVLDNLKEKTAQLAALQEENRSLREQVQRLTRTCRDISAILNKAGIDVAQ